MSEPIAQRTLVKSPPELWAEVSDPEVLARHLGEFGDVRIIRLEPETTVVWEGDRASGTVELEPSGWGTKVTLRAELAMIEAELEPEVVEPVAPPAPPVVVTPRRVGFFARWFGGQQPVPEPRIEEVAVPAPVAPPAAPPPEPAVAPERAAEVLSDVLDQLGSAHHRPFSRG